MAKKNYEREAKESDAGEPEPGEAVEGKRPVSMNKTVEKTVEKTETKMETRPETLNEDERGEKGMDTKKPGHRQLVAVKRWADHVLGRYKDIIKAMWLITPEEFERATDLTVILLLNDVQQIDHITRRDVETSAMEAEEIVKEHDGIRIHASFYMLSDYWDMIRHGSPVTFSEIRHGLPVYDPGGFFVPLKKLLEEGKIPCTKEAVRHLIAKAPLRVKRVRYLFKVRILEHVYAAVVDAAQAALIVQGVAPPAPKQVPEAVKMHLVERGLLEPEYERYCREIIRYWKDVEHGNVSEVPGGTLDVMLEKGTRFVSRMAALMSSLEKETKAGGSEAEQAGQAGQAGQAVRQASQGSQG